jgi:hypothetical protein
MHVCRPSLFLKYSTAPLAGCGSLVQFNQILPQKGRTSATAGDEIRPGWKNLIEMFGQNSAEPVRWSVHFMEGRSRSVQQPIALYTQQSVGCLMRDSVSGVADVFYDLLNQWGHKRSSRPAAAGNPSICRNLLSLEKARCGRKLSS